MGKKLTVMDGRVIKCIIEEALLLKAQNLNQLKSLISFQIYFYSKKLLVKFVAKKEEATMKKNA